MRSVPLETSDIEASLFRLPEWQRVSVDGVVRIERAYRFGDQAHSNSFAQLLGELADHANHHPSILVQRQCVTVAWWTFGIGALTSIDFVMAERSDRPGSPHTSRIFPATLLVLPSATAVRCR